MQNRSPVFFFCLIFLLISLACNIPVISNTGSTGTPTPAETLTTIISQTPTLLTNTASPTIPVDTLTITATKSVTPIPPTFTPTLAPIPCNRAQYISDVNYPDDTTVIINANFTKTWRIKNTGSCAWTSGYKVIFDSGDRLDAPDETTLTGGSVPPDATVDISVPLKAPGTVGTYRGYFRLRSPDNIVFGIGGSGIDAFWVQIKTDVIHLLVPMQPKLPFKFFTPTPTPTLASLHIIPGLIVTLHFP